MSTPPDFSRRAAETADSDALTGYTALARAALAAETNPWMAFSRFMHQAIQDGAGAVLPAIAGQIPATSELRTAGADYIDALSDLITAAHRTGQLRQDTGAGDIPLLFICLNSPSTPTNPNFHGHHPWPLPHAHARRPSSRRRQQHPSRPPHHRRVWPSCRASWGSPLSIR